MPCADLIQHAPDSGRTLHTPACGGARWQVDGCFFFFDHETVGEAPTV
jgi:hypothetical protein